MSSISQRTIPSAAFITNAAKVIPERLVFNRLVAEYGDLVWAMARCTSPTVEHAENLSVGVFDLIAQRIGEFQGGRFDEELLIRNIAIRYLLKEKLDFRYNRVSTDAF